MEPRSSVTAPRVKRRNFVSACWAAGDEIADVGFPYFGGEGSEHFNKVELQNVLMHKLPVKRLQLADGSTALVTTVYDLTMANYGLGARPERRKLRDQL